MTDFPWLTALVLLPLVGSAATALLPVRPGSTVPQRVALGFSGATFVLALVLTGGYDVGAGLQYTETLQWIGAFGAHYALGVDGLGLVMVLLTTFLVPVVVVAAWHEGADRPRSFFAWVLALEAISLVVFTAADVFLFYVVFEAILIPAYFLIAGFGREGSTRAAVKFLIYMLAGGLVMLAAVIGLYVVSVDTGSPTYLVSELAALSIDPGTQKWLFVAFFFAFAVKAPLFPVHTWLPDTTAAATPGVNVLLVCVLDKIGAYGMLRFCLGIFPDAAQWATPVVVALALVSIVYGALVAIGQDDVFRLVAYASLSHFGFIVLGIFVLSSQGGSGAVLYMVNHGLATAGLFLLAGFLVRRSGSVSIRAHGGAEKVVPVLAGVFLVFALATLGLPGLSTFVSEFLVLVSAFDQAWYVGAVAVTGIVLAAVYMLWFYQRAMTGPTVPALERARDLDRREVAAVTPVLAAVVVFGFFPAPLLDVINPYTADVLEHVGVSDDPPTAPAAEHAGTAGGDEEGDH